MKPNAKSVYAPQWTESGFGAPSLFDKYLSGSSFAKTEVTTPAVNIIDEQDHLRLEMVAPGMNKNAFKIEVQNNVLTILYENEHERGRNIPMKYKLREHNYHSFVRSFYLPDFTMADKIEANYKDGILYLRIPKMEEAISRQIKVM